MKKYFFLPQHCVYAHDVWAKNEREARAWIRNFLGKRTLKGIPVWEA